MPIVQISHRAFAASESKAIVSPSGDQRGDPWERPGPRVSRVAPDPSAFASHTSLRSSARLEEKAIRLPSGEYCGLKSKSEDAMSGATGVVNGSPVGMLPNRGTPVPDALLHRDMWVADAVYTPLWTPLLNAAKAEGAEVMTGRELAIYQAADAFELFTGLKPSAVEMGNAFDAVMAKRYAKVNAA